MNLSHTGEYALRAVLYLAERDRGEPMRVGQVAEALAVPQNYLSKILHVLAREGVLTSLRGPRGGFRLAAAPGEVRLADIVRQFGDLGERRRCLLGRASCSDANPCGAHDRWVEVAGRISQFFEETTVADVLASAAAHGHSAVGAEVPLEG